MSVKKPLKNPYVLLLIIILLASAGVIPLATIPSYTTAYEGAKARYKGVFWHENSKAYTNTQKHGASVAMFDTVMKFDADKADEGKPNLVGEMTAVMIPYKTWTRPDFVPSSWWADWVTCKNPSKTYEWQIENEDGSISYYRMEEWKTKWFFSISTEWDSTSPWYDWGNEESNTQRYKNLDVWFEFDILPTWYFENTTSTYFAIAKIELTHFRNDRLEDTGKSYGPNPNMRVAPMSPPSILTVYTSLFGDQVSVDEQTFYSFQGKKLNPQYFRDKVYAYVSLLDFGTQQWWDDWPTHFVSVGDVVTMGFTVTQFVVGEWKVQDIGDIPDDYGRTAKVTGTGFYFFAPLLSWLTSPAGLLFLFLTLTIIAIILLAIFAPGVLGLASALGRRAAKQVQKKGGS